MTGTHFNSFQHIQPKKKPLYEQNKSFKSSRIHYYLNKIKDKKQDDAFKSQDYEDFDANISVIDRDGTHVNGLSAANLSRKRDSIDLISMDSNLSKSVSSQGRTKLQKSFAETKFNSTMKEYMTAINYMQKDELNFNPKVKGKKKIFNESVKVYT